MSYTPGPWRYDAATKTIRSEPTNYWLATMDSWDGAVDHEANAELIAQAPEVLETCKKLVKNRLDHNAEIKTTQQAFFWLGAGVATLLIFGWMGMTGCAGTPYFQVDGGYNYVDHAGSWDYGEGIGARLEVGLDWSTAECGIYHFSHPFSHQHEAAMNGVSCGKRWGGRND